ncbi:hypothetical protein BCR37DRAFT_386580 [Protomyces lactucae-debilis]|uniref:sn-1-specific diacylglycerol lipase n=1 Tax=Protomyces lactucae-debilis TaxID=2754530 RepID=A0A1Y2FKG1_PROLT|nr:uncharacterized protein BCR37DRAFT_386580 [Protomyces lactucae-debilis]ORY84419.1 hypothetical protein BCR37DRAFT_386580 [Protomyces lactucae-debilis]
MPGSNALQRYDDKVARDALATLLPAQVAGAISQLAGLSSFSLHVSSILVYNLIEAGRQGTQMSLEATRKVGSALLYAHRANGVADEEYAKYLESWSATGTHLLYCSISLVEIFAQASFSILQVSSAGGFYSAMESVRTIDALFGSNETSRMLASIICFMRKELESEGNYHGLFYGLTKALSTFAMLQNLTYGRTAQERQDRICWDVISIGRGDLPASATHCQVKPTIADNTIPSDILRQIPVNATYSIATETTVTTKTIVNIDDIAGHAIPAGKSRFSFEKVRKKLKTSKFIKQRQAIYGGAPVLSPTTTRERPDTFIALQYRFGEPECISQRREKPIIPRRDNRSQPPSPSKNALPSRRPYSLSTNHSTSSIVTISLHPWESPPEERPQSQTWPPVLLERLLYRFHRFSTAAYGQVFLQLLGFSDPSHWASHHFVRDLNDHENHAAFGAHVGCSTADILLSSYAPGNTTRASPSIVYFVSVDHQSQSVVVSLRGTLGFSDLLTDLTAEYHPYTRRGARGQPEQHFVHKGVLEAAQRLASNTALLACINTALRQRPHFGLVLTGHSLGGSVAALLALEWSLPAQQVTGDVQLPGYAHYLQLQGLPTVPISSFGYGTPACLSPSMCCATAGLIVTCVNGFDVVPSLSFGLVHDFKSISQVLSQDESGVLARIGKRLVSGAAAGIQASAADDDYLFAVLKTLRCQMDHDKLVPPGRLLNIQASRHRCHSPTAGHAMQGTRVVVSEVVDVQARFGEMVFAKTMLSDHSPVAYEASLQALVRGLAEQSEQQQSGDETFVDEQ